MKKRRSSGVSSIEFAFGMLVLLPLLLGTGVTGINMVRTLQTVQLARDAGVTKTPTFVLGRYRVAGWHYYEVFQSVMEKQNVPLRSALANSSLSSEHQCDG